MEEDEAQVVGAEDAELKCPICWELLHQPHSLNPCLHLFCDPCLRRLARANIQTCPICRAVITGCHLDEGNTNISLKVKRIKENKGGFMSEDTGGFLHCQNKYSKSLS